MLTNDKILRGGEITTPGEFEYNTSFLVFLLPKDEPVDDICILRVRLHATNPDELQIGKLQEFPFVVNTWNPIVVKKLELTSDILSKYRIFWGSEYEEW